MGKQGTAFRYVAKAHREIEALTWPLDSKHCFDKFKAMVKSFKQPDAAQCASSGASEEFGELEQLFLDIVTRMNDEVSSKEELRATEAEKERALKEAGSRVREDATMNQGMRADSGKE